MVLLVYSHHNSTQCGEAPHVALFLHRVFLSPTTSSSASNMVIDYMCVYAYMYVNVHVYIHMPV